MIGKETKIPKKNIEDVSNLSKNIKINSAGMNHFAMLHLMAVESMWATIKELLPEEDFENYTYSFNYKENKIRCIGKKSKDEE